MNDCKINLLELAEVVSDDEYEDIIKFAIGSNLTIEYIYKYIDDAYNSLDSFGEDVETSRLELSTNCLTQILNFLLEMLSYFCYNQYIMVIDKEHSIKILEILSKFIELYWEENQAPSNYNEYDADAFCFNWQFIQFITIDAEMFCKYYDLLARYKSDVTRKLKNDQEAINSIEAYCKIQNLGGSKNG